MELLYIWIGKFNNIERQGFNFSGQYNFKYDEEKAILSISENENYVPGLFNMHDKAVVTNVTGIVGENGSGKSSVLEFIKNHIIYGAGGMQYKAIVCFEQKGGRFIYHDKSIRISSGNYEEYGFRLKQLATKKNGPLTVFDDIPEIHGITFVNFSNIYDTKQETEYGGLINISTNYLIQNDIQEFAGKYESGIHPISAHREMELRRQLNFLVSDQGILLPFDPPDKILVGFIDADRAQLLPKGIDDPDSEIAQLLRPIDQYFEDKKANFLRNNNTIERLNAFFAKSLFYNIILYQDRFRLEALGSLMNAPNHKKYSDPIEFVRAFIESLSVAKVLLENILSFIESYRAFITGKQIHSNGNAFWVGRGQDDFEGFKLFIRSYNKSTPLTGYISYDWWELSSGQKAMLNLYSRFYDISDQSHRSRHNLHHNIVILIDEGEQLMHPQWQKKFLNLVLDFLPKLYGPAAYGAKRNLQFIFTSNSPFIASDLPLNHLILLQRDKQGKCLVRENSEFGSHTFAANIHSLFKHSFFIEDGLIGEFASRKINRVIKDLNSSKQITEQREREIQKIILMIGEPILRRKLMQLFEDKFSLDAETRLTQLEQEVANLKKQLGNDKDPTS